MSKWQQLINTLVHSPVEPVTESRTSNDIFVIQLSASSATATIAAYPIYTQTHTRRTHEKPNEFQPPTLGGQSKIFLFLFLNQKRNARDHYDIVFRMMVCFSRCRSLTRYTYWSGQLTLNPFSDMQIDVI